MDLKFFLPYFSLFLMTTCYAEYYSQPYCNQDEFLNENYFNNLKSGVFVDIGAHNGITFSNSYFFEKENQWTGICVEPIPERFAELRKNRKCICVQGCVSDRTGQDQLLLISSPQVTIEMLSGLLSKYDPRHLERIEHDLKIWGGSYGLIDVNCYLLNDLLSKQGLSHINYLSIDTEGGEYEILTSIDFSKYQIDVITVEDNYDDPRFHTFLESVGFKFVKRLGCDLLFVHQDFLHNL